MLFLALPLMAQDIPKPGVPTPVRASVEIEALLRDFLGRQNQGDNSVHRTFWSEDLIYTSSSGKRFGKADILKDLDSTPPPKLSDPKETYEAEDIQIRQYGDAAVLTFRLVARTKLRGKVTVQHYLNTGVFVQEDGPWQAVAWQATKAAKK